MSSRRNSFGLGPHFFQQNKHIKKKMIIRTTFKAVNCFSNVARVKYSVVIYLKTIVQIIVKAERGIS